WYHPLWPVLALCVLLRFRRDGRRDVIPAGAVTLAMLLGYFFVYVVAPADLNWQVGTTLDRLAAQLWPAVVISVFALLRAPEEFAPAAEASPARPRSSRKRT
ncbi:MAG TPA: hypothetical protein VEU07_09310, partial [Candidatus Acidoferrum sp.]|nr:hypothetical protein [Candidatus Acidoferrum sp.]